MLVLITDTGRVEQRVVELPEAVGRGPRRASAGACSTPAWTAAGSPSVADAVADLPERLRRGQAGRGRRCCRVLLETLVDGTRRGSCSAGGQPRAGPTSRVGLRDVLEALEEQVVLMRLLGEATTPSALTVRIGSENPYDGAAAARRSSPPATVRATRQLARLGVLGPTRMDYPGTMGAVRAVARYVGQILAESRRSLSGQTDYYAHPRRAP